MTKPVKTTQTEKPARARAGSKVPGASAKPPAARVAKAAKPGKAGPTTRREASSRTPKAVAADAGRMPDASARRTGAEPTHDEIAARAYFIHLRRHGAPGNPDQDWLLALSELRRERGQR